MSTAAQVARPKKPPTLLRKLRRYLRIKTEISKAYKLLDELEPEILEGLKKKKGQKLQIGRKGSQAAVLVDNFAEKNKVYRAHGISRYEVQLVDF